MKFKDLEWSTPIPRNKGEWKDHTARIELFEIYIQEYRHVCHVQTYYGDDEGRTFTEVEPSQQVNSIEEAKALGQRIFEEFITKSFFQ